MEELSVAKKNFIQYTNHAVSCGKISHAYLIELDNYDSDYDYVLSFVKMILTGCSYDDLKDLYNPVFSQIDDNNYPDIKVLSSNTSVINKSLIIDLQKEFSNKSLLGGKRIYIIKEADKLNASSSNTILKFLEEPEEDIIAFLLTDNRYHVLSTILSRCQVLSLKGSSIKVEIDPSVIDFLKCVLLPKSFFTKYNHYMNDVFVDKAIVKDHLRSIEEILVDYLENGDCHDTEISGLISDVSKECIVNIISIIEEEVPKLEFNVNLKLWFDGFFAKLIGVCSDD